MEIKFCRNNYTHGVDDVVSKLVDKYPDQKVVVAECLGFCEDCSQGPFAVVNGTLVTARTCEELYGKIEKYI